MLAPTAASDKGSYVLLLRSGAPSEASGRIKRLFRFRRLLFEVVLTFLAILSSVRALKWRDVVLRRIGGFEEASLAIYRSNSIATKETFALPRVLTVNPFGPSLTH